MKNNKVYTWFIFSLIVLEAECKRNYKHSEEELKLIKIVKIDQPKCDKNVTPIIIHSAAHSSGKYYERRQISRQSWVKEARSHQMKPIFVIGLPADDKTQEELEAEAKQFNDIIQFGFIDNYYNLTLKALSILRWIRKNCLTSDYVLKTDDDVLVNVELLNQMLKEKEFADGLTGKMLTTRSNRFSGHKWYMPYNVYKHSFYRFLYGFSYVMSKNAVKRLYKKASNFSEPVLDIDDLFMTGVLAGKANVRLYPDNRFDYYCGSNECFIKQLLVMHGCGAPNQTMLMWNHWQQSNTNHCHSSWSDPFEFEFLNFRFSLDFYR